MAISSALGIAGAVPIGVVNPFAGATAPSGWLLCFGQTVSRTQYSGLFLTIGTTYGSGDGSTTFNLPDLRGRTIAGEDDMGGTAANRLTSGGSGIAGATLGATGGAETHTLTSAQMPSHTHTQDAHGHTQFRNTSVLEQWAGTGAGGNSAPAMPTGPDSFKYPLASTNTGYSVGNATATNQNTGGGGAHNNTQPTIILNYIIKAQ